MRLGFYLDEVVVDLTAEFQKYLENTYGIDWPLGCFVHYDFVKCVFHSDPEFNNRIVKDMLLIANDESVQFEAKPVEGAVEILYKLKKAGHKLFFITSRPKQNQPMTFKWLRKYNIPFDDLSVIGHGTPKGLYGLKYNLDMYVDDLHKNLESMWLYKSAGRRVFC